MQPATIPPRPPDFLLEAQEASASPLLAQAFENAFLAMALITLDGWFLWANRAMCRLVGRPGAELVALGLAGVTHPEDLDARLAALRQAVREDRGGYRVETRYLRRDGHAIGTMVISSLLRDAAGRPVCFFDQVQAEGGVRAQVARDLHDGLGQLLTSIALVAKSLHDQTEGEPRRRLGELGVLIDDAVAATRALIWGLRPPELSGTDLVGSLHRMAAMAREGAGLRVDVEAAGLDVPLTSEVETTAFRVVQEALVNVMRHATASTVSITATRVGSVLIAVVEDDGRGFDPAASGRRGGMGLRSMVERAGLAGGGVRVESTPGKGTVVRLDLPCPVPIDGLSPTDPWSPERLGSTPERQ